jgi:hypothetical protein
MMHPALRPVLQLLREPSSACGLSLAQWDLVVRVGRRADLLARMAERLAGAGLDTAVPAPVWRHFDAARRLSLRQHDELRHEVRRLQPLFGRIGLPLVLLKGSAYVLGGLQAGQGRMVSDIDILVPRARLGEAESVLMINGWVSTKPDAYDQHYYRTWMHELPPMRHLRRGTVLDVHHALVPLSGALPPQMDAILAAARPLPGWPGVCALGPADLVLHSAAHLYTEGELEMGLRGLVDLQLLLDELGRDSGFWPALLARADALGWQAPLAQALRHLDQVLEWPTPAAAAGWLSAQGPRGWRRPLVDALYRRALQPDHPLFAGALTAVSRSALYLRGHWLRMPPLLLARHLLQKAVMAWRSPPKAG